MDSFLMDTLTETLFESSTSSDSSGEELIREPQRKIVRIEDFVENTVNKYSDEMFRQHFRITRRVVYSLIDEYEESEFVPKNIGGAEKIGPEKAVLLTIWYLSNTESFRQISDRFNVSFSSAHRCLVRVVHFLLSLKNEYIKWPTEIEAHAIGDEFSKKQNIPHIIGAIDGCHVEVNKPKENSDSYINRKGYASLILQGVVNYNKLFIDVYCGEPGSLHDARVLKKSGLYRRAIENESSLFYGDMFLLGDSAYPNLHWLLPPFKDNGTLTEEQRRFNFKHSSTRMIVENAFGLLKGRFRRMFKFANLDFDLITKCMMVCCILHNICILRNDETEIVEAIVDEVSVNTYNEVEEEIRGRRQQLLHEISN